MEELRFIGITGGVGAGKSELLKYIGRHYKCEIYLADEVAHQVKRAGTPCFEALRELLGDEIVGADGEIDRRIMAERMFEDPGTVERVNSIVHPAVREFLKERLSRARENPNTELFFVEAALLVEAGYGSLVDELWYIHADSGLRADRLRRARGYGGDKIRRIMDNQLTEAEFRAACDFVIDNGGSLEDSCRQIDEKLEAFTWQE